MAWEVAKPDTASLWKEGEEEAARQSFLEACVKNFDRRHLAPYDIFPNPADAAKAWRCHDWLQDPAFLAEVTAAIDASEEDRWLDDVRHIAATAAAARDRLKALELIGEHKGFVSKGATNVNIDNRQATVRHIGVPYPVNDENRAEAEDRFRRRQERLVADARSTRPS